MHDGNFVMDGMVLPDDTPMPSLAEFAAVNAPVVFALDGHGTAIRNRYHTLSTDHLRFVAITRGRRRRPDRGRADGADRGRRRRATVQVPAEVLAAAA